MEKFECRKCGNEFSEDEISLEFVCDKDVRVCPHCQCPVEDRLDSSNVSLEFDLPQEIELYDDDGNVIERYKIYEDRSLIRDEVITFDIIVEKLFESEEKNTSDHSVVWNVKFPNHRYNCQNCVDFSYLEVGEKIKLQIEFVAIQIGDYYLTLCIE